jgi:hypothetical protein
MREDGCRRCDDQIQQTKDVPEVKDMDEAADLAEFMTPEELSALVKGNAGSSASPDTVVWRIAIANFKSEVEEILREQKKD